MVPTAPRDRTALRGEWRGLAVYLALTFAFSWATAVVLPNAWDYGSMPTVLQMLVVSTMYAVCMGWQPLVAVWMVRRWVDRSEVDDVFRAGPPPYYVVASLVPLAVMGFAMSVALIFGGYSATFPEPDRHVPATFEATVMVVAAMSCAFALLWIQALAEEVGWRGYFLLRFMQRLGPLRGLVLHGAIWGLWYAPLFLIANGGLAMSTARSGAFVVTCMLLGALLGWLRLASRSVLTTTLANSLLTVGAGLPFLLHGDDPGVRGAAYGPAGWVPMVLLIITILATKGRSVVRVPESSSRVPHVVFWVRPVNDNDDRTLH